MPCLKIFVDHVPCRWIWYVCVIKKIYIYIYIYNTNILLYAFISIYVPIAGQICLMVLYRVQAPNPSIPRLLSEGVNLDQGSNSRWLDSVGWIFMSFTRFPYFFSIIASDYLRHPQTIHLSLLLQSKIAEFIPCFMVALWLHHFSWFNYDQCISIPSYPIP